MKTLWTALVLAAALRAQTQSLSDAEALKLAGRGQELMEAAGMAIPELARAGAPLGEAARQAVDLMRSVSGNPPAPWQRYLQSLRAFLLVSDMVPKPAMLPDLTRQQLAELRDIDTRLAPYFETLLERVQAQARSGDRDNLARYREANARLGAPQAAKPRVVFYGDSITDGWRLNEYFPDRDFVNRGISGQITGQLLGRFRSDVLELKPAAVLVLAGTNDIARGSTQLAMQQNLASLADLADVYKIKVIFASLLPISDYHKASDPRNERSRERPPQHLLAMNEWLQKFCIQRGYTYLNYWPALADEAGMLKKDLADDGLHPNAAGYRLMAPLALEAIDKSLNPAKPGTKKPRQ
jgi:lysophospholipase L1-like esterase